MAKEDYMGKYTGKKAVVTGGTIGMGLVTVKALVEGGTEVLLTGRNEQNLEAAQRELGPQAHVVRCCARALTESSHNTQNLSPGHRTYGLRAGKSISQ